MVRAIDREDQAVAEVNDALWDKAFYVDEIFPAFKEWRTDYDGRVFAARRQENIPGTPYSWSLSVGQPEAVVGDDEVERIATMIVIEASPEYRKYIPHFEGFMPYWDREGGHLFIFNIRFSVDPKSGDIEILHVDQPRGYGRGKDLRPIIQSKLEEKFKGESQ